MPTMVEYDDPAQKIARAVVTQWLGEFNPSPQIDFQQSEVLQMLIVRALIGRAMSRPGFGQVNSSGVIVPLCPYCFGIGKILDDVSHANLPPSEFDIAVMRQRDVYLVALQFIVDGYASPDVDQVDYPVKVYQVARAALDACRTSPVTSHQSNTEAEGRK